jgi:hypothetical protein
MLLLTVGLGLLNDVHEPCVLDVDEIGLFVSVRVVR